MRDRDALETDHEFEPSPYCDCQACSELCHHHYGLDDVCMKERHQHQVKLTQCDYPSYEAFLANTEVEWDGTRIDKRK